MLDTAPTAEKMTNLLGKSLYDLWDSLIALIDESYDMEHIWNNGGKAWKYEYKYRRDDKTLCSLYARENRIGFMVIFGKDERTKFEADRVDYLEETRVVYDQAKTYHDGKWMMFEPKDTSMFNDFLKLLSIKRKPNKI